jgi:GH24 family phage-related lysozyme (muramidase)
VLLKGILATFNFERGFFMEKFMKPSKNCFDLIVHCEGYHTKLADGRCKAYPDPLSGGVPWTIGYGSTRNMDANVSVKAGLIIDEPTARRWMETEACNMAEELQAKFSLVSFNQNQIDALTSLAYNVGVGGFGETLCAAINAKDWAKVGETMMLYVNKGTDVEAGLTERRREEVALLLKEGDARPPINVDDSVTWLDFFRRDDKGTFGIAAMAADKCVAVYEGSQTEFLISFIKRFKNAKNCLVAPSAKAWPATYIPPIIVPPTGIVTYKKGEDVQLSKNFHLSEYECPCSRCKYTKVDMKHVALLQQLRDKVGPIHITSAHRCPEHNDEVGGVSNSQHLDGIATDIYSDSISAMALSSAAEFFDGVGLYISQSFVHVDSRGYSARWNG